MSLGFCLNGYFSTLSILLYSASLAKIFFSRTVRVLRALKEFCDSCKIGFGSRSARSWLPWREDGEIRGLVPCSLPPTLMPACSAVMIHIIPFSCTSFDIDFQGLQFK
jgi:hypothetical protein